MIDRIVILGGGVVGLCTAWFCRQHGFDVTLVEADAADRDGCSFRNAGMIVPSHFTPLAAPGVLGQGLKWMWRRESPFAIRPRLSTALLRWGVRFWKASTPARVNAAAPLLSELHLASRRLFAQFSRSPEVDFGLVSRGLLMLCRTRDGLAAETHLAERARRLGLPAEVLDPRQLRELEPDVQMAVQGAVFFPRDCHLVPERFMAHLQNELREQGVRFLWNTRARGWRSNDQRVVALQTDRGPVEGDRFVVCGGLWSAGLVRALGIDLPLQAGKGYSLTLGHPPQQPRLCSLLTEARVAVTPMGSTLRVGGTMELGATARNTVNAPRVRGITRSFCDYFPAFRPEDFADLEVWTGLRPVSPDGLPYLGRTRRRSNLFVAAGHGMMGLSLGPITGQIVAQWLAGKTPPFDLNLLDVDRFG